MRNEEYSPSSTDPLCSGLVLGARGWSALLPSFMSPSQAADRLARLQETQRAALSTDGTGSMRLERAGYLLAVGSGRLARAVAARVWSIVRALMPRRNRRVRAAGRLISRIDTHDRRGLC